jgi:hypothetical protein
MKHRKKMENIKTPFDHYFNNTGACYTDYIFNALGLFVSASMEHVDARRAENQ